MNPIDRYKVFVQQPTVPHYRIPFFDALASQYGAGFVVSASRSVVDGPATADVERHYLDLDHQCISLLGRRAYWQHNMLPPHCATQGDVAVICANPRYLSTYRYALEARRRGMGVVWWGHGWSPTSRQWAIRLRRALMQTVDAVLLYSDAEVAEWRDRLPASIHVVGAQNAIDQSRSTEQQEHWDSKRLEKFQHDNQLAYRKLLVFCGRLRTRPYTGVDLLLKALAILKKSDPSYLVVIIGDGDDRERLLELTKQLEVQDQVKWLGPLFDEAAIAPWFMSSLCFVYPGPIGLSILHAMGYGLPVITHADRRRHNPEIVVLRDQWNGLTFVDNDVDSLASQIAAIANDPALRRALSKNAHVTAHQNYTLEMMVSRFTEAANYAHRCSIHKLRKHQSIVDTREA